VKSPRWIEPLALLLLHQESLAEHGGLPGTRGAKAFESAIARPRNLHAYEPEADLARLAAAYGFGLTRGHPFSDGNKRAGFLAIGLFLGLNGFSLDADPVEATEIILRFAGGRLSESVLAEWVRERIVRQR
jgi:death-on-curing protein